MTAGKTIDDVASVTTSKWGEDLTNIPKADPYRLLHAYIVVGNKEMARRYHVAVLERQRDLGDGLGQYVPIEMALGVNHKEIQHVLYGKEN